MEAVQQRSEVVGADREHRRQTDGGIHRIASADPVPEAEHVGGVDPELRHLLRIGGHGHEVLGDRLDVAAEPGQQPLARALRVGHRFERRERLRRHDEERFGRVEVAGRLREVGSVDVRDETEGHRTIAVVSERFVGHHGTEIGAPDADVDDVANRLAGVPLPRAAPHTVRELSHGVEDGVNLGHHVLAVHHDRGTARCSQGHVENGAVFRHVDLVAPEHGVDALAEAALLGQPTQQHDGLIGDAILGVIEVDPDGLRGQAVATGRVGGEQRPQVTLADVVPVRLERLP
jgi:hypothetical protein